MKTEQIQLSSFVVGNAYSRKDIAELGQVTPPVGSRDPHWSNGIVVFDNATVLLVTLQKTHYDYEDSFEDQEFLWQSQNQQTQSSPTIRALQSGQSQAHLFVRIQAKVKGVTEPFVYCGRLSQPGLADAKPVTCRFESLDYDVYARGELSRIYNWRANQTPSHMQEERREQARSSMPRTGSGQGRMQDVKRKIAIEQWAMNHAKQHYKEAGYNDVEDTSKNRPFDLECRKEGELRRVEVKGTVNLGHSVELTHNEVRAAHEDGVPTDLYILHSITLGDAQGVPVPSGGISRKITDWKPLKEHLKPTNYSYQVPPEDD